MNAQDKTMSLEALQNLLSEQWNNNACLGYLLVALEDLGFSEKAIKDVVLSTQLGFNNMTTKEAAAYYCQSQY